MAIGSQLKTVVLLGALTGILLWIGSFWGANGLTFAIIFSLIINVGSYWFSDKIVLRIYRAKPVEEKDQPRLYKIVQEVAHLANLPMPKVYIIQTPTPNAFATGRNPKNAAVAATTGILDLLSNDELKGVMAHEMAHVKNRDTLISTIAATIAGVISYIAMMARWGAMFGGFGGRDRQGGSGLELLVLAILTPILATIIRLAISRSREYIADETGAKIVHSSSGLAAALEKLEHGIARHPFRSTSQTNATAHLFIANPFRGRGLFKLFSTHPPMKERVKRLKDLQI